MLKSILRKTYHLTHDALFNTLGWNPFFPSKFNGKPIKTGHVSTEHLASPSLDDQLVSSLKASGIKVEDFNIDIAGYQSYMNRNPYSDDYFGGGKDPKRNFTEKTLEHYVSTHFMNLDSDSRFIDIAACDSPFYQIIKKEYGVKESYQQDLVYQKGLKGDKIGGFGHELPFEDNSIDAVTLHCSLEHFEGNSDTLFFKTLEKQLKPGGVAVVLPYYIANEYTIHVDPIFNLLRRHKVHLDDSKRFQLRYANWYQFYSRHCDTQAIWNRILTPCPGLELTIHRVQNFRDVDKSCYLRFVGVFKKKQ
jgi:SAM-dependent methyltransferase